VRLCLQLLRVVWADGIPDNEVADSLAQAAAELDSEDIDSYLVLLMLACGLKQVQPCLQLVAATQGAEGRQQRLYTALMTSLGIYVQGGRLPDGLRSSDTIALAGALLTGIPGEPPPSFGRFSSCVKELKIWFVGGPGSVTPDLPTTSMTLSCQVYSIKRHVDCPVPPPHRCAAYSDRCSG
jgi:hypothetical protein